MDLSLSDLLSPNRMFCSFIEIGNVRMSWGASWLKTKHHDSRATCPRWPCDLHPSLGVLGFWIFNPPISCAWPALLYLTQIAADGLVVFSSFYLPVCSQSSELPAASNLLPVWGRLELHCWLVVCCWGCRWVWSERWSVWRSMSDAGSDSAKWSRATKWVSIKFSLFNEGRCFLKNNVKS